MDVFVLLNVGHSAWVAIMFIVCGVGRWKKYTKSQTYTVQQGTTI
jgi:hypothetical protein